MGAGGLLACEDACAPYLLRALGSAFPRNAHNAWPDHLADAFATLELSPGASREAIRTAYLRLALASHPDRQGPGGASSANGDAFKRASAAYELLWREVAVGKRAR